MTQKLFSIIAVIVLLVSCAPSQTALPIPTATITKIPTVTPYPTPTLINTSTPLPTFTPVIMSGNDLDQSGMVNYWSQVIEKDPTNIDAYYQRASTIYKSTRAIGSLEGYIANLKRALQDINTAISLNANKGDYFSLREQIYYSLAGTSDYIVDSRYWSSLALQDANKAVELGTSAEYPDRTVVDDLIATNQCDKALTSTQALISKLPAGDVSLGGLLHIRSRAYACLGRLNDALKSVNDSMFNNENMEYKNELKAQYLILLGRYTEALPILDERICKCTLSGWHHYLRAEIYYHIGKKDLVQNELITGMMGTWGRGGMLPYVEAQLALDAGHKQDAIQLLQLAEATFNDPIYNTLRWKVQDELKAYGVEPLVVTPSVQNPATLIP